MRPRPRSDSRASRSSSTSRPIALVSVDYHNKPLCSDPYPDDPAPGRPGCLTDSDGFVMLDKLGPATYFIEVVPPPQLQPEQPERHRARHGPVGPDDHDRRRPQLQAGVEEGSDGTGAPGEQLWEPPERRAPAYWFGFVCAAAASRPGHRRDHRHGPQLGRGGRRSTCCTYGEPGARTRSSRCPTANRPHRVHRPGRRPATSTSRTSRPATTTWPIWDEQLSYIMRFKPVTVAPDRPST